MKKIIKGKRINIDKVNYLLFTDTETIGSIYTTNKEGVVPFEIGIKVYDLKNQKVVFTRSFIVQSIFNHRYTMLSSFSANKYPQYKEMVANDKVNYFLGSVRLIMEKIKRIIDKYNISIMVAHNGQFDKDAIERLCQDYNNEQGEKAKGKQFQKVYNPFGDLDLLDTMQISTIITDTKKYCDYCKANKHIIDKSKKESVFITNSGRVRLTAQAIYSFIIDNPQYQESHTALNDIDDEIRIFQESYNLLGNKLVKLNIAPDWHEYEN